jgi:signal transduction histidine kinase
VDAVTPAVGHASPGRRRADLIAITAALAYSASFIVAASPTGDLPAAIPWQADAAVGLAGAATLWWRRRWPTALAVALVPLGAVSVMATGAILVALYTVALHRRLPAAAALGVAHVATAPVYVALQPQQPQYPLWLDLVTHSALAVAVIGWGMYAGARQQLLTSLRERAARAEAEQHLRAGQARHAERSRIARDMHDVLAERIADLSVRAEGLQVAVGGDPEQIATAAGAVRAGAHEALQELRQVIGVLRGENPTKGRP